MEVTDSDKHYSLLQSGIDYGRKNFYDTGPWAARKHISTDEEV
jgi:hypothetical protein